MVCRTTFSLPKIDVFQEAVEKANALQLQVQTATFQKLESDLETDVAAIKEWAEKEKSRKASWQAMVLTHKRKRYVRGLAQVKKFSDDELAYRCGDSTTAAQELAGFRHNLEQVIPAHGEKRLGEFYFETSECSNQV